MMISGSIKVNNACGIVGFPCCGARQKLRLTKQARFLPTAATRSAPFLRHRRRSPCSPTALHPDTDGIIHDENGKSNHNLRFRPGIRFAIKRGGCDPSPIHLQQLAKQGEDDGGQKTGHHQREAADCASQFADFVGSCGTNDVTGSAEGHTLRNRIRHHVMPLLRQENPRFAENVSAMALRLRQDEEALDALILRLFYAPK